MTTTSRQAFEAWWEDFITDHDEWRFADSDSLRWAAWQASRQQALGEAAAVCTDRANAMVKSPKPHYGIPHALNNAADLIRELK